VANRPTWVSQLEVFNEDSGWQDSSSCQPQPKSAEGDRPFVEKKISGRLLPEMDNPPVRHPKNL